MLILSPLLILPDLDKVFFCGYSHVRMVWDYVHCKKHSYICFMYDTCSAYTYCPNFQNMCATEYHIWTIGITTYCMYCIYLGKYCILYCRLYYCKLHINSIVGTYCRYCMYTPIVGHRYI